MVQKEVYEALKVPLPAEAITPHPTKPYLSNIKAIYVVERFNDVFGLGGWSITNDVVEAGEKMVVVKSTFTAGEIVVKDIFGGNDNTDRGDAYKGACTDALTKIGSYLGVGMDVYKGLSDKGKKAGVGTKLVGVKVQAPMEQSLTAPCDNATCKGTAKLQFGKLCFNCNSFVKTGGRIAKLRSEGAVEDRKSTRLNSSHIQKSRMPSSA